MSDQRRTGRWLQHITIAWNVAEVGVTVGLGLAAGSLALIAFGLDSLVEVFASVVVLWHMADKDTRSARDRMARRLVGAAFAVLSTYLLAASLHAFWSRAEPDSSPLGIAYLAVTAVVMFTLSAWKTRIGRSLESEPFLAEARMTFLDGWLATAILVALALNTFLGWWWADAVAAAIIGVVAGRESIELLTATDYPSKANHPEPNTAGPEG